MQEYVEWDDPILRKWLDLVVNPRTQIMYKTSIRLFLSFSGKTPKQLIEEAMEDQNKSPFEKQDVVRRQLIKFHQWMRTEAPRKIPRGKGRAEVVGKGLGTITASCYTNNIRSFYSIYGIVLKFKGASRIPVGEVENPRMIVSPIEVKKLYDTARTLRDKAIVLFLFQTGCDTSTLCTLKYRHVKKGLEDNEEPLRLDLVRPKTSAKFFTFIGSDSIYALKNYLGELKSKGIELKEEDPLFIKRVYRKKRTGIDEVTVTMMLKELALRSGLVKKNNNGQSFNPLGGHAFRESFTTILHNKGQGLKDDHILFLSAHKQGSISQAYLKQDGEQLRKLYKENEALLSIGLTALPAVVDRREIEQIKEDSEKKIASLQAEVATLRKMIESTNKFLSAQANKNPYAGEEAIQDIEKLEE